jgi:asparagine synthase (glutamine-hydrolysing)
MCGIAGFTAPGVDAPDILAAMLIALRHRGPDAEGQYQDRGVALAHRRLAVVDLQGGAQPRVDAASGDALVFNGEIYGYAALAGELREAGIALQDQSDTEVLFQMLRRHGVRKTLDRIDGMFAFAYRCGTTGLLYLARDRFGEKPIYYAPCATGLVFGSEVSAIACHPAFRPPAPDPLAAFSLLQFEYLPGALSGWQGIFKLPPASLLTCDDGRIAIVPYWALPRAGAAVKLDEAVDRLDGLLTGAVRRQLVADVPLGVFLSGGIDSSLLTALAARQAPGITALTVRAGGGSFDETGFAAQAARHIGVRHEVVELSDGDMAAALDAITAQLSEPLADSSLLPTYLVCRAARARMTVALGGDGADELFAGYPNFRVQRFAPAMRLLPRASASIVAFMLDLLPPGSGYMDMRFRLAQLAQGFGQPPERQSYFWMAPFGPARMAALWHPDMALDGLSRDAFAPIDAAAAAPASAETLLQQFLLTYLPDNILMKTDRAAMFNSLEVRAPFLDRHLAEYAASLPMSLKYQDGSTKHVLKQVARRYLPESLVSRKKHGFAVPIGGLLRSLFQERVRDTLLSTSNPVSAWFSRGAIETLLAEHMSGKRDHGKRLWALFILFTVTGRSFAPAPAAPHVLAGTA